MPRRLYLDTADLLDIGDGRVPAEHQALLHAMADTDTMLVVSRDHIFDVAHAGDTALESLVKAVESFGVVLGVVDGPDQVEPLTQERTDIVVQPCTNFRELAYHDKARTNVAKLRATYEQIHAGERSAQAAAWGVSRGDVASRKANELYRAAFITLVRDWMGDDPEPIVAFWEAKNGIQVTAHERASVLAALHGAKDMISAAKAILAAEGIDATEALRMHAQWESDAEAYPGQLLGYRVSLGRRRNVRRVPRQSDLLDHDHVKHMPYVDIATCDAGTLHEVSNLAPKMKLPRHPAVFQTGRLGEVAARIGALSK